MIFFNVKIDNFSDFKRVFKNYNQFLLYVIEIIE